MGPICLSRYLKLTSVELLRELTPKWVMMKPLLWSLTMDLECARPALLVTMHPDVSSRPLSEGRSTRVSWLAWDTRTVSWRRGPVQEGYPAPEVPHRARHRHQLGRHGEDLAPHLLQRASCHPRGAPHPPH